MAYEDMTTERSGQRQPTQREGQTARNIERQTARVPSDFFLWLGVGSIALSAGLFAFGKRQGANFVGMWVPTVLILGLYNKLVRLAGHDAYEPQLD
jgi:hypothetical protein